VRLSRPRLALRAALLAVGGAFMLWRAAQAWRGAKALEGGAAALQSWLAPVEALVGGLALLTALVAAAGLRSRRRAPTLRLDREPPDRSAHRREGP
jgi:hypothetical protein